jgi:predicted metal-dependent hydrolase
MSGESREPLPPYAFVPGHQWPHPVSSPEGHSFGADRTAVDPINRGEWSRSAQYLRGIALFNAGYYWEAHEAWEALWMAHGRSGPTADMLKGLIKLAAAGVKIRQRQPRGAITHALRAAEALKRARAEGGERQLGLELTEWIARTLAIAREPPNDPQPAGAPVSKVFSFEIAPSAGE